MEQPSGSATDSGWDLLREGSWDAARAAFDRSLAREETPEALEGLSWAAWWLDDEDAVFTARERAYRLYRAAGNPTAAGRMATWLAVDELDFHGATVVAAAWVGRARRLLEGLEPGPDHGWLAFMEGYMALGAGESEKAGALGIQAAAVGRAWGVADLEMLGLALEGSALVSRARVAEGMHRLDEATATALERDAAIPISSAWTCCFLVTACAAVRDYERAFQWCDRIADFAERYGSRYMRAFCRAEYAAVDLWRGRWREAEELLEAAMADFARSRPAMAAGPAAALAELRRRQSRLAEATELLEKAAGSGAAHLCTARMALDRGDSLQAAELLDRLLRTLPADVGVARAPAIELLVHARSARGEHDEARAALAELREVQGLVGTPALGAGADFAEGVLTAAGGDHEHARALLEDAVDGFDRCGSPYEGALARIALAATLNALERPEAAGREARAAHERLLELGAPADAEKARRVAATATGEPEADGVTPREREVLALLAEGLTNREIAERLVLSEHTVHRHVTNILRKLELPSRAAAAAHAVRSGLAGRPGA
ncbi:MAG: LuxR C-terminal-related transcriptional regulator [Thermoleophilaceae bacterium]